MEAVKTLREAGSVTSMEVTKRSLEKTVEYGKITEADYVVFVDSSLMTPVTVYDIEASAKKKVTFQTFLRSIGGQK